MNQMRECQVSFSRRCPIRHCVEVHNIRFGYWGSQQRMDSIKKLRDEYREMGFAFISSFVVGPSSPPHMPVEYRYQRAIGCGITFSDKGERGCDA